jgi:hypothetical protein
MLGNNIVQVKSRDSEDDLESLAIPSEEAVVPLKFECNTIEDPQLYLRQMVEANSKSLIRLVRLQRLCSSHILEQSWKKYCKIQLNASFRCQRPLNWVYHMLRMSHFSQPNPNHARLKCEIVLGHINPQSSQNTKPLLLLTNKTIPVNS